ncbi:hypothetical protein WJX72_007190 [[Myrmecia] bisecta]|uniref:Uncharacterized protein n=1 Tax=[Myrmecia] bisecta TaxID=41462 RepID=A0AAW1QRB6_9CHLO
MPMHQLEAFISAPKFQRLYKLKEERDALTAFAPFIVPSRNYEDKFFCALTCQLINARLKTIKQHMQGKKFKVSKEAYENGQHKLLEEPLLESSEETEEPVYSIKEP